jgi:hypothetical protein
MRRIITSREKDREKRHNEEVHDLYFSQILIRTFKSRRFGWVGHVARVRYMVEEAKGKRPRWWRILKWLLETWV